MIVSRLRKGTFRKAASSTVATLNTYGVGFVREGAKNVAQFAGNVSRKESMKALLKELVMSATYRQDSKLTEEIKQKDLFNRYYARGPRVRLSAEQLRDQHLCISGAMSNKMYGPGVMPWQPEGIWNSPYNGDRWNTSAGEDQYRARDAAVEIFRARRAEPRRRPDPFADDRPDRRHPRRDPQPGGKGWQRRRHPQ